MKTLQNIFIFIGIILSIAIICAVIKYYFGDFIGGIFLGYFSTLFGINIDKIYI